MGRGLNLQDPMALNSGWERLIRQGRGTEARARTAVIKNDMKNDLRRQKANRLHTEALLRKMELMQASPRCFESILPGQMPQLPTVYSRICEKEVLPGWVIAPAPYL